MKKVLFAFATLLIISLILVPHKNVQAQNIEDGLVEVTTATMPSMMDSQSSQSSKVNYELPYPGMLPDNPFYFLKTLRDRIIKMLISDPFKKAQFNNLTGQKRMYAGKLLVDKKKYDLALVTIEKSNNYLDEAIESIKQARKEEPDNIDINAFLDNLKTVSLKHLEVMSEIKPKFDKKYSGKVEWEITRLEKIKKNVDALIKPQKQNQ